MEALAEIVLFHLEQRRRDEGAAHLQQIYAGDGGAEDDDALCCGDGDLVVGTIVVGLGIVDVVGDRF